MLKFKGRNSLLWFCLKNMNKRRLQSYVGDDRSWKTTISQPTILPSSVNFSTPVNQEIIQGRAMTEVLVEA